MFQSSPVPKDGRYSHPDTANSPADPFQSSPVPKDGRYIAPSIGIRAAAISFNPRPSRRTGATAVIVAPSMCVLSFNPRPSRRTGATHFQGGQHDRRRVSILARPEGRALLANAAASGTVMRFQSSPVPKDGRYGPYPPVRRWWSRFNPRPSRRTGATRCRPLR